MGARILDGRALAQRLQAEIAADVARLRQEHGLVPRLAALLAGDDPASAQYVRMKRRACEKVGIESQTLELDADSEQREVERALRAFNADPAVHGILVQLPLPPQIDEQKTLAQVSLARDVDGFHPLHIGQLAMKGREPAFTPATPSGVMVMLEDAGVSLAGAHAVVLGRSNIVGLPLALMLQKANATVTLCHSHTRDLPALVRQADVLIAALGRPLFVQAEWLKPGAAVIDVGTNRVEDPSSERGWRWAGDVDFERARQVAGAISRVPGGVGPMTITMLLRHTLLAAQRSLGPHV
ncbi:MAG: bifunctional 5,10-methylenetetrahydrofolate dehydrogenase/5,10-methenyltetrahydrofolate cyclohydrolase [Anaerolineaceae bacterium]|nr:bifunctional 5,10-methylenetetrahydrofolate dehydrogenase/5,10-methenyltetrahydrofolate cyclohydrolase [Anaerolineaceae bacterium]